MQLGILFGSVSILPSQPDKRFHFESIGASASAGDVLGVSLHTSAVMRLKCQVSGTEGLCERQLNNADICDSEKDIWTAYHAVNATQGLVQSMST